MRSFILLCSFLTGLVLLAPVPRSDAEPHELGYSNETVIVEDERTWCGDIPDVNFNWTFENGYCWGHGANCPPYYGVFCEAFDLGPGVIDCAAYWLTQIGWFHDRPADCYVWGGGITTPPDLVLALVPGVVFTNVPYWPAVGRNNVEIGLYVEGEFSTGCWGAWDEPCFWYYAADEDGPGGHPWTLIHPGHGYPSGWQHPNVAFPGCQAMGIGIYFTRDASSVEEHPGEGGVIESPTWGGIKTLFAR